MDDKSVCIGRGMVGNSTMEAFGITKFISKTNANITLSDLPNYRYVFICLPTPTLDGKQNLDDFRFYTRILKKAKKDNIIIVRSTVLPGSCENLEYDCGIPVVHAPEFLTEETWKSDTDWPDIVVLGGDHIGALQEVTGIFKARYKGSEFIVTDTKTSEMIKYAINCFYAVKVVYANQIYDYCRRHGINYETVKHAMYARKWIGKNHLDVWHKKGRGAGGKCLGKDIDAFATYASLPLIDLANKMNKALLFSDPKRYGT